MKANRILIADDEPYVARVLKLVLLKEGYEVTCVNNGKQALDSYRETRPDIIVTDVKMPHMTGRQLVETIRSSDRDMPFPLSMMPIAASSGLE